MTQHESPSYEQATAWRRPIALVVAGAVASFVLLTTLFVHILQGGLVSGPTNETPPAAQEAQESATPQEADETAEPEPPEEEPVDPRDVRHELEGDAADAVRATNAYGIVTQAVGALEDKGFTVAFVVHDLASGRELTYDSAEELYPASSIKGPFTTAVYQQQVETGDMRLESVEPVARVTILESSDEGYRTLHQMCGTRGFVQWLKDAGVEPGSYGSYDAMVVWNYPHICAHQLAQMWVHAYDYLTTDTEPARQLADFFANREVSALRDALGPDVATWSKMGWFDSFSEYRSEPATVEAGVVFADDGPYVVAVMTTAPALIDELVPLHQALYRASQDMR